MLHQITLDQLLVLLLVGAVAGFLATHIVAGHGYGLLGDLLVGIIGALIGTFLLTAVVTTYVLGPLGVTDASILGQIIIAFIGAVLLLAVMRLVAGRGQGRRGR